MSKMRDLINDLEMEILSLKKENNELKMALSGRTFSESNDKVKLNKCIYALKTLKNYNLSKLKTRMIEDCLAEVLK